MLWKIELLDICVLRKVRCSFLWHVQVAEFCSRIFALACCLQNDKINICSHANEILKNTIEYAYVTTTVKMIKATYVIKGGKS